MARIRTVKPGLFRHEELYELEIESRLPVRLAFIGLFTCCDKEGRFNWRPRALKLDIMPYDDCDFSRVLHALSTRGFVVKYTSGGEEFGFIPTFTRHQVINNRESASELPDPCNCETIDASSTREPRVSDLHKGKGREGNVEGEGKGRGKDIGATKVAVFVLPEWVSKNTWNSFEEMRAKIRKPMTIRAKQLIIGKLDKLRMEGFNPEEILDNSTVNSWQDVFPPREKTNGHGKPRELRYPSDCPIIDMSPFITEEPISEN